MIKVCVCVKRVVDYNVAVHVKTDQTGVDIDNVKMSMNPFDEIAVEQAIQLKEQGVASDVHVLSIGSQASQETIRQALAMGADSGTLVVVDQQYESINIAKIMHAVFQQDMPDLIIMGKQAIDDDCNQTGQMLAQLLNWPQGTFISDLRIKDQQAIVWREVDEGQQKISLQLPCVLTTDLRLNEPRFAKLPDIVKAKQKPLQCIELETLCLTLKQHHTTVKVAPPVSKSAGVILENMQQLVAALRDKERMI